jgi:hypothetical protein
MQVKFARWHVRGQTLAGILGVIGLSLFFASWGLWMDYAYTKPQFPNAAVGRVYPLNTHGSIAYLNNQERFLLYGLGVLAGLFFCSGAIVDVISSRRNVASLSR